MKKVRSLICLTLALTLLLYSLPRFDLGGIGSKPAGFVILWTFFALLVIGAHLYEWLEVAEERMPPHAGFLKKPRRRSRVYGR